MNLAPVLVVGFIVLGIYKLFELFVRKSERIALIEKLPALLSSNEVGKAISFPEISFVKRDFGSWALRISLLLVGVGLGCLLAFIIQAGMLDFASYNLKDWHAREEMRQMRFVLYFSFIAICGGLSLFVAYLVERKQIKVQKDL